MASATTTSHSPNFQTDNGEFTGAETITKSDATVLTGIRGLWVGGAGNLTLRTIEGDTVQLVGVQAGTLVPMRVDMVLDATTATSIVGLR